MEIESAKTNDGRYYLDLELEEKEVIALMNLVGSVTGGKDGPRNVMDKIFYALLNLGAPNMASDEPQTFRLPDTYEGYEKY